jgi:hypothetical protein
MARRAFPSLSGSKSGWAQLPQKDRHQQQPFFDCSDEVKRPETIHVDKTIRSCPARRYGSDRLRSVPYHVAIEGEAIAAVGRDLPRGANEIDACGKLVLPGGIERSLVNYFKRPST